MQAIGEVLKENAVLPPPAVAEEIPAPPRVSAERDYLNRFERLHADLAAIPGVVSAFSRHIPVGDEGGYRRVVIVVEDEKTRGSSELLHAEMRFTAQTASGAWYLPVLVRTRAEVERMGSFKRVRPFYVRGHQSSWLADLRDWVVRQEANARGEAVAARAEEDEQAMWEGAES